MENFQVNWLAVLAAAIVSMIIGMLWYSPLLFGKKWMQLAGQKPDEKPKGAGKAYAMSFLGTLVMSYVLALFVKNLSIEGVADGMVLGFFVWLGFVATVVSSEYIFAVQKKSWGLYFLNTGFQLVSLAAMGMILATWL